MQQVVRSVNALQGRSVSGQWSVVSGARHGQSVMYRANNRDGVEDVSQPSCCSLSSTVASS